MGWVVWRRGLVIAPWLCYRVDPCRTATLSQKYIWQERTRMWRGEEGRCGKDGDMRREGKGEGDGMEKRSMEGCRDGVESVV